MSESTKVIFTTNRYLLQELVNDPTAIEKYSHIVLDEVHERSLEADLLNLIVKMQMTSRKVRLIAMSATLPVNLFSRYFMAAAVQAPQPIHAGRRRHRADIIYLEQITSYFGKDRPLSSEMSALVRKNVQTFNADVHTEPEAASTVRPLASSAGPLRSGAAAEFEESSGEDDEDALGTAAASQAPAEVKGAKGNAKGPQPLSSQQQQDITTTPAVFSGADRLIVEIVQRVAKGGQTVLIYVPGLADVFALLDALAVLEKPASDDERPLKRPTIHIIALHLLSQRDEQDRAVTTAPPQDTAHVVVATDMLESSITIPSASVVIDLGLRERLTQDPIRHACRKKTVWASQTAARQRAGRCGRTAPGLCIRLFTRAFRNQKLSLTDQADMLCLPPEKVYLEVRHLATRLPLVSVAGGENKVAEAGAPPPKPVHKRAWSAIDLMRLAPSPVTDARRVATLSAKLDELGAITADGDEGEITVLGDLMSALPLDGRLCRLVLFGCLLGAPSDAVVMAAGLACEDPFSMPELSASGIGNDRYHKYAQELQKSLQARRQCDAGHFSDPLALRTLFISWLSGFRDDIIADPEYLCSGPVGLGFASRTRAMVTQIAADEQRCLQIIALIIDIAVRLLPFLPEASDPHRQLSAMLDILMPARSGFGSRIGGTRLRASTEAEAALPRVQECFCQDPGHLKAMLTCALAPQFMSGQVAATADHRKDAKQALHDLLGSGLDPAESIVLNLDGANAQDPAVLDGLQQVLQVMTGDTDTGALRIAPADGNRVLVSLEDSKGDSLANEAVVTCLDPVGESLKPLPHAVQLIGGLSAGRGKAVVPLQDAPMFTISRPMSPYEVVWDVPQGPSSELDGKGASKGKKGEWRQGRGTCDWRSIFGILGSCDVDVHVMPAEGWGPSQLPLPSVQRVFGVYTRTSPPGPLPRITPDVPVHGVTLLSTEVDSVLSIALMIAFLRHHHECQLGVAFGSGTIETVKLLGSIEIRLRDHGVGELLIMDDVRLINDLRHALSHAFQQGRSARPATVAASRRPSVQKEDVVAATAADRALGLISALEVGMPLRQLRPDGDDAGNPSATDALTALREALCAPRKFGDAPTPEAVQVVNMHNAARPFGGRAGAIKAFKLFQPLADLEKIANQRVRQPGGLVHDISPAAKRARLSGSLHAQRGQEEEAWPEEGYEVEEPAGLAEIGGGEFQEELVQDDLDGEEQIEEGIEEGIEEEAADIEPEDTGVPRVAKGSLKGATVKGVTGAKGAMNGKGAKAFMRPTAKAAAVVMPPVRQMKGQPGFFKGGAKTGVAGKGGLVRGRGWN